jgi:hypothetical protein
MIAPSRSAATTAIGNNLPVSRLIWGQAGSGKGGAKRLWNDSEEQMPCCFRSRTQKVAQGRGEWAMPRCNNALEDELQYSVPVIHTDEIDEEQPALMLGSAGRDMGADGTKYLIGHPCTLDLKIATANSPYLGGQVGLRFYHLDYVG